MHLLLPQGRNRTEQCLCPQLRRQDPLRRVLLYDASQVKSALLKSDADLVQAQRSLILDPKDKAVREGARANGVSDAWLEAAVKSPVYTLVKEYGLALPLHPEFRTMPMAYYIPPLSPVIASRTGSYELAEHGSIPSLDTLRVPINYMARLFSGGNREIVADVLKKLIALRQYMRQQNLGESQDEKILRDVSLDKEAAARLHRLFAIGGYNERNVIPPQQREEQEPARRKVGKGFGMLIKPRGEYDEARQDVPCPCAGLFLSLGQGRTAPVIDADRNAYRRER